MPLLGLAVTCETFGPIGPKVFGCAPVCCANARDNCDVWTRAMDPTRNVPAARIKSVLRVLPFFSIVLFSYNCIYGKPKRVNRNILNQKSLGLKLDPLGFRTASGTCCSPKPVSTDHADVPKTLAFS